MTTGTPIRLIITGMSCGHCVAAVTDALKNVAGASVEEVGIGRATLVADPTAGDPSAVASAAVEAVRDAGYDAEIAEP